jgi:hypothetical protein
MHLTSGATLPNLHLVIVILLTPPYLRATIRGKTLYLRGRPRGPFLGAQLATFHQGLEEVSRWCDTQLATFHQVVRDILYSKTSPFLKLQLATFHQAGAKKTR